MDFFVLRWGWVDKNMSNFNFEFSFIAGK
jgi:hypothetical protein